MLSLITQWLPDAAPASTLAAALCELVGQRVIPRELDRDLETARVWFTALLESPAADPSRLAAIIGMPVADASRRVDAVSRSPFLNALFEPESMRKEVMSNG